jgi:hypothetical protein
MPTRADEVVELGELDDEPVPVVLVERPFFEVVLNESGLEREFGLFLYAR